MTGPAVPGPGPDPQAPPPAGHHRPGSAAPVARPHPRAGTALGLGLGGLLGSCLLLPLLLSPFAWYLGATARRDIEREPARWTGRGNATAGFVMGIAGTLLLVAGGLGAAALAALAVLTSGLDTGYGG